MLRLLVLLWLTLPLGVIGSATAQHEVLLHGKIIFDDGRPGANIEFQVDNLHPFYTDRKGQFGSMVPASFNSPGQVRLLNNKLTLANWSYDTEQRFLQIIIRTARQNIIGRVITRQGDPINHATVSIAVKGTEVGSGVSDENGYFFFTIPADIKITPQTVIKVNQAVLPPQDVNILDKQGYFLHIYYQPLQTAIYAVVVYDYRNRLQTNAKVIYNGQEFLTNGKGIAYVPMGSLQDMQQLKVAGMHILRRNFSSPLKRISLYASSAPSNKAPKTVVDSGQMYMQYFDEITRSLEGNKAQIEQYNSLIINEMEKLTKKFSSDNNIHPTEARRYLARMETLEQLLLKNQTLLAHGNQQTLRALMRLKEAITAKDSIAQKATRQLAALEKANQELDRANKRIASDARIKLMIATGIMAIFIGMSLAIGYYYKRTVRQKKELEAANTELRNTLAALKRTQAQLVQQDRMTSLGQMAAGIAHEINNPINFIYAGADSLRRNFADLKQLIAIYRNPALHNGSKQQAIEQWESIHDPETLINESDELVASLKRGATRTFEIVQGLRTFARINEENLVKITNIEASLDNVLMLLSGKMGNRISIERHYGNIPTIECFPAKLNQVFLNLITNAMEAIADKGKISITTTYPVRGPYMPTAIQEAVSITIADTGKGISYKNLPHIFDPFFTTKEVGDGVGLGLSIAMSIVKEHGGNIIAQSQEGEGSQFIVILPRQLTHTYKV